MLIRKSLISVHFSSLSSQPAMPDLSLLPTLVSEVSRDSFCITLHPRLLEDRSAPDADLTRARRSAFIWRVV